MLSLILTALISLAPAKEFKAQDYCPLISVITFESVDNVIKCLKTNKKKKIIVVSPGGMMDAGEILIKYINKNNVTVLCVQCHSMAAFLWLNADKKELGEGASLMMHYGFIMVEEMSRFTIKELRDLADSLESHAESFLQCLKPETRQYFINMMKRGDYFFGQSVIDLHEIKYTLINKPKQVE
jgi:ATP-dependent protease ClpP protease subunit